MAFNRHRVNSISMHCSSFFSTLSLTFFASSIGANPPLLLVTSHLWLHKRTPCLTWLSHPHVLTTTEMSRKDVRRAVRHAESWCWFSLCLDMHTHVHRHRTRRSPCFMSNIQTLHYLPPAVEHVPIGWSVRGRARSFQSFSLLILCRSISCCCEHLMQPICRIWRMTF